MTEAASVHAGHNSELTPAEMKALHFHHLRAVMAQKEVLDAARTEYKRLRKVAKSDGIVMADLDFMMRCAELEDVSIVPEELKRRAEIASWYALPVNYQPDMFSDRTPMDDRAFEEGKAAGLAGKNPEPPYDAASKAGQRWLEGWHEGQRIMREDLQSAMEKRNAAKDELLKGSDDPGFPDEMQEAAE